MLSLLANLPRREPVLIRLEARLNMVNSCRDPHAVREIDLCKLTQRILIQVGVELR